MVSFIESLRSVLREISDPSDQTSQMDLLVNAFNNNPGLYRSRNRRPRTDLMVKGLTGIKFARGLVAEAAVRAIGGSLNPDQDLAFERYIDIAIYTGKWWEGQRFTDLAVEVENNWAEIKGTMKDLLLFQAKRKWALFYQKDLDKGATDLSEAITVASSTFDRQGLSESPETKYEVLVLPENVSSGGLLGVDVLHAAFLSKDMKAAVRPAKVKL